MTSVCLGFFPTNGPPIHLERHNFHVFPPNHLIQASKNVPQGEGQFLVGPHAQKTTPNVIFFLESLCV
jgi:hypothetical protein